MYKSVQKLTYPAQRCVSFGTKSTITSQAYIIRTVHVVHSLSDSKQEALDSLYIFPLVWLYAMFIAGSQGFCKEIAISNA